MKGKKCFSFYFHNLSHTFKPKFLWKWKVKKIKKWIFLILSKSWFFRRREIIFIKSLWQGNSLFLFWDCVLQNNNWENSKRKTITKHCWIVDESAHSAKQYLVESPIVFGYDDMGDVPVKILWVQENLL